MIIDIREIPVFYINMDSDTEKRESMQSMLKDNGFKNIIRFKAIEDPKMYYRGLAESMHKILCSSEQLPFLILEDDCKINNTNFIFEVPDDSDGLYLGVDKHPAIGSENFPKYQKVQGNLYRIINMVSAHAILYISKDMKEMFNKICRYCAFENPYYADQYFPAVQKFFKIYAFNEPLFYQSGIGNSKTNMLHKTKIKLSDHI